MAYTAAHGPPLLDATHAWAPATGPPPPVLGDSHHEPRVLPQIVIDRNRGWRSLPELADNREPRTYGIGEIPYPSRKLGKTLPYECHIEAAGRLDLLETQNAIVQGFADMDGEGTMTVTPWPAFGGVVWTYTARVLALEFDPAWSIRDDAATYDWGFVLTLRMSDPRFYTSGTGYT